MSGKFYLDSKNGIVCEVCAGLSTYFNIDLLLLRILFLLFFNYTLFIYIVIALVKTEKDDEQSN